jgi:hypothetical protein
MSRIRSGCCWLLKVFGKGRVDLHRKRCGLVIWVDLIFIIMVQPTSLRRLAETYQAILFQSIV